MRPVRTADTSSARAFGRRLVAAGAVGVSLVSAAGAQSGPTAPSVGRALARIKADNAWTVSSRSSCADTLAALQGIGARRRVQKRLEALGLRKVRIDSIGNVIAERRGAGNGPTVVIAGHLDTVFPEGTTSR